MSRAAKEAGLLVLPPLMMMSLVGLLIESVPSPVISVRVVAPPLSTTPTTIALEVETPGSPSTVSVAPLAISIVCKPVAVPSVCLKFNSPTR